ncbi:O-antigen ligase family protein [Fictibacillus fluitans]|uniref:O-antigen ligase family protein n=1 Tax=Fictibacillus fluitans TaxID=3058422 RepID=A0ABT8HZ97_9BACL|nr:O-antigen ligase family protein [Fictibacillus sp. NE201]MDN4526108.1 O-antigen ligase family protein [Fictibacillus sp. NE201]
MPDLRNILESKITQVILALLFAAFAGSWLLGRVPVQSPVLLSGALVGYIILIAVFLAARPVIQEIPFTTLLFYLLVFTSFLGAGILSIPAGPITMFPYRIVYMVMVPVFLYLALYRREGLQWDKVKIKPVLYFHLFWVLYALFSLSWTRSFSMGAVDLIFLVIGISLIFFMVLLLKKEEEYIHVYWIWLVMFAVLTAIGLWNHVTHNHLAISRINQVADYQKGIPTSVFVNENDFASFISVSFFLALAFVHRTKSWLLKAAGGSVMLVSLYVLVYTSSRANYIAIPLGLLFWFVFLTNRNVKKALILLGAAGGVALAAMYPAKLMAVVTKVEGILISLMTSDAPEAEITSVDIRSNLIKNAWLFFERSFGFGIGSGNSKYYLMHFAEYPTKGIINVHNWWMEILANYGAMIFIGYILLYLWVILQLFRIFRQSYTRYEKMISEGLLGGMIAFSLSCISPSSQISLNYLWLLFAFSLSFINYWRVKQNERPYRPMK